MHQFHIPERSIQNRNVHISVLNGSFWDIEQVNSGICEIGLLPWKLVNQKFNSKYPRGQWVKIDPSSLWGIVVTYFTTCKLADLILTLHQSYHQNCQLFTSHNYRNLTWKNDWWRAFELWLNIKTVKIPIIKIRSCEKPSYHYNERISHLYNGNLYTHKKSTLYWDSPQVD